LGIAFRCIISYAGLWQGTRPHIPCQDRMYPEPKAKPFLSSQYANVAMTKHVVIVGSKMAVEMDKYTEDKK